MTPDSTVVLWRELHEISNKVCTHFGWSYGKILPETRMRARMFGECEPCDKCHNTEHVDEVNCNEKILHIRVHQLSNPRKALAARTIIRTLAHELAHLGVWNHGPAHRQLEQEVRNYIHELGYEIS